MSWVGIAIYIVGFLCMIGFQDSDTDAAIGWGVIVTIYAVAFAIVCLATSDKSQNHDAVLEKLSQYAEFKEKGLITESEFAERKRRLIGK